MIRRASKHGLLFTMLSILLLASITGTATFAAFSATATISGTISFEGSLQITATGTPEAGHSSGEEISGSVSGWDIDMKVTVGNPSTIALNGNNLTSVSIDGHGMPFAYTVTLQFDTAATHKVSTNYAFQVGSTVAAVSGATGARDSSDTTNRTAKWTGTVSAGATSTISFTIADLLAAANVTINNAYLHYTSGNIDAANAQLVISATTNV